MSIKYSNQFGDTIIEVMLAVAVVGMVLGASYATATRALRTGRFAQEQTEALKLAESQMEKLKYFAGLPVGSAGPNIFDSVSTKFCIDDNFVRINQCDSISGLYKLVTDYTPAANLFKVTVTWPRNSAVDGNVQVAYKLYRQAQ